MTEAPSATFLERVHGRLIIPFWSSLPLRPSFTSQRKRIACRYTFRLYSLVCVWGGRHGRRRTKIFSSVVCKRLQLYSLHERVAGALEDAGEVPRAAQSDVPLNRPSAATTEVAAS